MVTAQRDDTGKCLAFLRGAELVRVGGGGTREDAVVAFLNLVESPSVVVPEEAPLIIQGIQVLGSWEDVRGDWDITAVEHSSPAVERVGVQGDVVPSAEATSG